MNAVIRPEYQQRAIEEKAELDERLRKLNAFIFTDQCMALPFDERTRLARQALTMTQYSNILGERIENFTT